MTQMATLGMKVAAAQRRALPCEAVNLFLADGAIAGQEVFHAHLHVIPRHSGDGFGLSFPSRYETETRDRLDASRLRKAIASTP
jgi:diadenosine tetraphosphate (Ap4A) HIT family hydrolase